MSLLTGERVDARSEANRVSAVEAAAGAYSLTICGFADANGINA